MEDADQFPVLHRSLDEAAVRYEELSVEECERRGVARVTRLEAPQFGAALEFYVRDDAGGRPSFEATHTKIQRLGHVVFAVPDPQAAVDFFCEVLNFQRSDAIDGGVILIRPFPTPFHHGVGIAPADHSRFHHLNLMVSEIDDIGKALHRLRRHDVPVVFGPGRHPASDSVFLYYLDPDGLTIEYSYGMELFPEMDPRAPRLLPKQPESLDTWGSVRDPRMGAFGAIHPAEIV